MNPNPIPNGQYGPMPQLQRSEPQPHPHPQRESSGFHSHDPKFQIPDDKPYYWANPIEALRRFFVKYADCTGRASRSEFWWSFAACAIVLVLVCTVGLHHNIYTLAGCIVLWFLALGTPLLTLSIRRLHDTGQPGSRVVFPLALIVGPIILTILMLMDTQSLELGGGIVIVFAWVFFLAPVQFVGSVWYFILLSFGPDPAGVWFDKGVKVSGCAGGRVCKDDGGMSNEHHLDAGDACDTNDSDREIDHEAVRSVASGAQGEVHKSENEESQRA